MQRIVMINQIREVQKREYVLEDEKKKLDIQKQKLYERQKAVEESIMQANLLQL